MLLIWPQVTIIEEVAHLILGALVRVMMDVTIVARATQGEISALWVAVATQLLQAPLGPDRAVALDVREAVVVKATKKTARAIGSHL